MNKSLTMSLERTSVPVRTFEAVALQDPSINTLFKQIGDFLSIKGGAHRLRILWMILSTIFVVAFSTLAGAMTGYAPVTDPFLHGQDGQLVPFDSYLNVIYIVHDADRVGLENPLILTNIPGSANGRCTYESGTRLCAKKG
jgi:hypothetical protein